MRRPTRCGFTLLELLIAIALMLALIGSMYGFLLDMLRSRMQAHEFGGQQHAANTLIDRLEADLTACIVGDSTVGAGVQGDEHRLRLLTRGVFATAADSNADEADVFGDLQMSEYRYIAAEARLEAIRAPATSSTSGPLRFLPFHDPTVPIARVRFRYFDGSQWHDEFDSLRAGGLPAAVEVAIWFRVQAELEITDLSPSPSEAQRSSTTSMAAERASGNFDDDAYARRPDSSGDENPPDRLRVIAILDWASDAERSGP